MKIRIELEANETIAGVTAEREVSRIKHQTASGETVMDLEREETEALARRALDAAISVAFQ